jgi:hypothetical protein
MYNEMLPFLNASILLTAARKLDLPTVQGEKNQENRDIPGKEKCDHPLIHFQIPQ